MLRFFLCFVLSMSAVFAAAPDQVSVSSGRLKGAVSGKVAAFKGIPFAAPPVGANRWRAPQPVAPWQGVRDATAYGADCMQLPFPSDAAPLGVQPAEDCLYVNVWTPAERKGKLPVMFWIYGGGFVNGGTSPAVYDGTHFAESGVVLVSANYRLGRFGFFAHPALTKENPSGPLGNYAFMDQIAALRWVQKNIAAFGGDPGNVTIFGESAGGHSVLTLLTTPAAKGLFHKAIVESGGGRSLLGPTRSVADGEKVGLAFAKKAGVAGEGPEALAALRALPADRVVDKMNMMTMSNPTYVGPMVDGKLVVESVQQALLAGHQAKVPVISGANSSEFGFMFAKTMDELFAPFGDKAEAARRAYNPDNQTNVQVVAMRIGADKSFVEPARFVARQVTAGGQRAYAYRFSYVAESMRKEWKNGAPHASEIPFVFNTVDARYGDKLTEGDKKTAEAALAYWVAFAKTGEPAPKGLPRWPAYDRSGDKILNFTERGPEVMADPWKERLDMIEAQAVAQQPAATR